MAEAAVEEQSRIRFYCHVCKQQFTNITNDYTCPVCSDGFIEELHDVESSSSGGPADVDMDELLNTGFREAPESALGGSAGAHPFRLLRHPHDPNGRRRHYYRLGPPNHPTGSTAVTADANVGGPPTMINAYDQLIRDFFAYVGVPTAPGGSSMGGNGRRLMAGGAASGGAPGRADQVTLTPMFFIGNPGDYVWGHDGLDSVITLMLNQMEPTGPPPLSAQKIDEIPKCEIGQDELDKKLQCSVCLEDFQLREHCRKLACLHIFHESCIVPWLELHGTCPICRDTFTFTDAQDGDQSEDMDIDSIPDRIGNLFSDIQSHPRMMEALNSTLPATRTTSSNWTAASTSSDRVGLRSTSVAVGGPTGVSSANVSNNRRNSNSSNEMPSQSSSAVPPSEQQQASSSSAGASSPANLPTRNNLNFHLDDGLD